jgi:hypothetical protein
MKVQLAGEEDLDRGGANKTDSVEDLMQQKASLRPGVGLAEKIFAIPGSSARHSSRTGKLADSGDHRQFTKP